MRNLLDQSELLALAASLRPELPVTVTGPDDEGKCGRVGEVGVIAFKGDRDDWLVRFGDDQQRAWYAGGSLKGAEL